MLEAEYNATAIDSLLTGSYETASGDIDFNLYGTDSYNDMVMAIESMITSLKERANTLLIKLNEVIESVKAGVGLSGTDPSYVDANGHPVYESELMHKSVNMVLFEGTESQVTLKGSMPFGQITKVSTDTLNSTTYINTEDGSWTGGVTP